jgi:hypothetical protein
MIKLPAREDGNWTVQFANEKLPDIVATKNITFDKEGFVRLSKPVIAIANDTDSSNLGLVVGTVTVSGISRYMLLTENKQFHLEWNTGFVSFAEDFTTNAPTGYPGSNSATIFNAEGTITGTDSGTKIASFNRDNTSWTVESPTLGAFELHTVVNFKSRNTLAVANGYNTVVQYNTSYASGGSTLTLPTEQRVASMAYNRGLLGIATTDGVNQGQGMFYVWDGATTAANYSFPIGANAGFIVMPWRETFAILTGAGQILVWVGLGMDSLYNFPSYYGSSMDGSSYYTGNAKDVSWLLDGDILLFSKDSFLTTSDDYGAKYLPEQQGGVWCIDKTVGMYHRHGLTSQKAQNEILHAGSVNTTTSEITVSSAPETGTPVTYSDGGGTTLTGLTHGATYYTIKVDATKVKLATTYANALAGTAVSITSAPNGAKETIATTAVNISTEVITMTTAPASQTLVRYDAGGGTVAGGLADGKVYVVHKASATTIKLGYDAVGASLGDPVVNITGTGNNDQSIESVTHTLTFLPKSDFGQLLLDTAQGSISQILFTDQSTGYLPFSQYLFGADAPARSGTYGHAICTCLKNTENRGYVVTSVIRSQQLQDDWQKIFIKHSQLTGEFDKIAVKYRTQIARPLVQYLYNDANYTGAITWTDSDTFTTTDTQFADVLAGDEVEVVQGAGSGYLLHVSSISETGGTYTVNLDEAVKNISASDTGRVVVSRWTKLTTLDATTPQNNDGYSELPLAVRSKSIQFKIELRGEDVEIEEILIAQKTIKFAV